MNPRFTCYDNDGVTIDRYTITFEGDDFPANPGFVYAIGASENPFSPQGFGQHCEAMPGDHLGKIVALDRLPDSVQHLVLMELFDDDLMPLAKAYQSAIGRVPSPSVMAKWQNASSEIRKQCLNEWRSLAS